MAEQATQAVQAGIRGIEKQDYNLLWKTLQALNAIDYQQFALDPPSIAAGARGTVTAAFDGATAGDFVLALPESLGTTGLFVESVEVTSDGTVSIRLHNTTSGAVDLGSTTFHVLLVKANKEEVDIQEIGTP